MDDREINRASRPAGRPDSTPTAKPTADDPQGLSDHTQRRIGLHLRAMYDTIVQQPVPDRFRDLIARMDDANPETRDKT